MLIKYCHILVIVLAQVMGLFPVVNIFSENIEKIRFKLWSFRAAFSALWIANACAFLFFEVLRVTNDEKINAKSIGKVI
jgi:Trehalose receptor